MKIIYLISRLVLGALFVFSGFVKGVDPMGSSYKFTEYLEAWHIEFLLPYSLPLACLLCLVEFGLGIALLANLWRRAVAWLTLAFLLFFTITTLISALTNPISDCGCFGDAIKLSNWNTFYKNIFFLIFALLHLKGSYLLPSSACLLCLRQKASFVVILLFGGFLWYSCTHLPIIDFRPYHEGANIVAGMRVPVGAPADEYQNIFTYENKNTGERQEFDETNYPWQDSLNWTYVDMQSKLIKKGYEAPISNFYMMTDEAEDVKDFFLHDELPTLLLVSTHIEDVKWEYTRKLPELVAYCQEKQLSFVGLTASDISTATNLAFAHQLPMEFFNGDETTLKTMIRSNPGLILIHHGTIIKKWGCRDFPTVKNFEQVISNLKI